VAATERGGKLRKREREGLKNGSRQTGSDEEMPTIAFSVNYWTPIGFVFRPQTIIPSDRGSITLGGQIA
jgi:hypothetical protein